jgi:hypothetical protein
MLEMPKRYVIIIYILKKKASVNQYFYRRFALSIIS